MRGESVVSRDRPISPLRTPCIWVSRIRPELPRHVSSRQQTQPSTLFTNLLTLSTMRIRRKTRTHVICTLNNDDIRTIIVITTGARRQGIFSVTSKCNKYTYSTRLHCISNVCIIDAVCAPNCIMTPSARPTLGGAQVPDLEMQREIVVEHNFCNFSCANVKNMHGRRAKMGEIILFFHC